MPKSKRSKVVALTKTDKKGREWKDTLFKKIRESIDEHDYAWVFRIDNMRNTYLKDVRKAWNDSRVFFGKTKVIAKALGDTPENEYQNNLRFLSKLVVGDVGLLFTSHAPSVVQEWFATFNPHSYPRASTPSPITLTVPSGPLHSRGGQIPSSEDQLLPHSLESELRKLGMPTRLERGVIMLDDEYTVCTEGEILDSKQTRLLKLFGVACAEFRVNLVGYWKKDKDGVGEVKIFDQGGAMKMHVDN